MSETSESVHLRTSSEKEAIDLLRRAKLAGYVFPAHNGWVSFVHFQGAQGSDVAEVRFRLEEANTGILVFYDYAEEHGCWVNVHQGKKPVGRLKASFTRPQGVFDRAVFERLGLVSSLGGGAIEQWVRRAHVWHERTRVPYLVAERLGLPRFRQFAYRWERDKLDADPQRIEVLANGTVKRPPKKTAPHVAVAPAKKTTSAKKKAASKKKATRAKNEPAKKTPKTKTTSAKKKSARR